MPVERSAGAVIYREEKEEPLFLLLHYEEGHWDFPKGHIESGETSKITIRREVEEETGIRRLAFRPGFKETIRYFFRSKKRGVLKFVVFFLVKTPQKEVFLSDEHIGYDWLPYRKALKRITYTSSRNVLRKAHSHLKRPGRPKKLP